MRPADPCVEKNFELWPGVLHLAAWGAGAHGAVEAGIDAARETVSTLIADGELIAGGSLDVLPRGAAGRRVPEACRAIMQAMGGQGAGASSLPPPLVALPGAVCDEVLAAMLASGAAGGAMASLGGAAAFRNPSGLYSGVPALAEMPPILTEFVRTLGGGVGGGVALAGLRSGFPGAGIADRVAVQANGAAMAALAAAMIADGVNVPGLKPGAARRPADPLVAQAFKGRMIGGEPGVLAPETIREALSSGVRLASSLRERRILRAAVLALKGRGRIIGSIDGNRLLRFGVSEWR